MFVYPWTTEGPNSFLLTILYFRQNSIYLNLGSIDIITVLLHRYFDVKTQYIIESNLKTQEFNLALIVLFQRFYFGKQSSPLLLIVS